MTDHIDVMDRSTRVAADVVANVKPDQLDDPTPCTEWTVRDLINHMVGVMQMFTTAAAGEPPSVNPFGSPDDVIGDDPRTAYDEARANLLRTWRERGLDGTVTLTVGDMPAQVAVTICLIDEMQHGWDLAKATGQDYQADEAVLDVAEEFTHQNMTPERRGEGSPFLEAVDPPAGASRTDQLAAFMGRRPFHR